jgi:hypothetical protein
MLTDADMLTYADVIAGEEAYMHDLRLEGQQRAYADGC